MKEIMTIIGLGNSLRGDDAIGPYIIEQLKSQAIAAQIDLVDAGTDAFIVLDHLISQDLVVLIDSAQMGEAPGTVRKVEINAQILAHIGDVISLHGFGFGEIYQMALGIGSVAKCILIGVEPKHTEFNCGMSEEVQRNIPQIMKFVFEESRHYDKKEDINY